MDLDSASVAKDTLDSAVEISEFVPGVDFTEIRIAWTSNSCRISCRL